MYYVKENKKEIQSTTDSEKIKADAVMQIGNIKVAVTESGTRPMVLGKSVDTSVQRPIMAMTGHSGYPKISGRVIRVFEISGFEKYNPKFVKNKQNPTFRVPDISGSNSGLPEQPEMQL